VSAIALC